MGIQAAPTYVHTAGDGTRFKADTTLVVESCPTCGILFAFPESLERSARRYSGDRPDGWHLSCPLGHTWHYTGKSEEQKLRDQLSRERGRAGRLASELDQTKAGLRAQKARGTRFKHERDAERARAHAGVCPVDGCRRHFKNLSRHMQTKHPDFEHA